MKSDWEKKIREICTYESEEDEVGGGHTCGYCLSEEQFKKLFTLLQQAKQEVIEECVELVRTIKNQSNENGSMDWFNALHCVIATLSRFKKKEGIK